MIDAVECQIPNCHIDCETLVVEASSVEACASEAVMLTSCLNSLDSGIGSNTCNSQQCLETSFISVHSDTTCESLTEAICTSSLSNCCCRQEMIANAECDYAKLHGSECQVKCTLNIEDQVDDGSGNGNGSLIENDDVVAAPTPGAPSTVAASTRDESAAAASARPLVVVTFVGLLGMLLA